MSNLPGGLGCLVKTTKQQAEKPRVWMDRHTPMITYTVCVRDVRDLCFACSGIILEVGYANAARTSCTACSTTAEAFSVTTCAPK
jgi:hypothetical protein